MCVWVCVSRLQLLLLSLLLAGAAAVLAMCFLVEPPFPPKLSPCCHRYVPAPSSPPPAAHPIFTPTCCHLPSLPSHAQKLRSGLSDIICLDGGRISGRGIVSGSSFKVDPLDKTDFCFGGTPHGQVRSQCDALSANALKHGSVRMGFLGGNTLALEAHPVGRCACLHPGPARMVFFCSAS